MTKDTFLLQRVQPAMTGLIDGSLSRLAPIFAVALATHRPHYAFIAGLATAKGAGVSMAFSEGLSDTGDLTGRGNPYLRGAITGAGTFLGGILHTLPVLIPQYRAALRLAAATVAFELLPVAAVVGVEFVITMLANPEALDDVLFGRDGIASALSSGQTWIDMSTVGPDAFRSAAARVPDGVAAVDAPVRGSIAEASEGHLH